MSQGTTRRTLEELLDLDQPALPDVRVWAASAVRPVEILPVEAGAGGENLVALQVTTRSALGAIAYGTGGIVVDHGWMRMLGAGSARVARTIAGWNRLDAEQHRCPGAILVADDAVGGFFAANDGGLPGPVGHVFYLAPDTRRWEHLEMSHTDWVYWVFTGDVDSFYESLRWPGWEGETRSLGGDQCFASGSRAPIPVDDAWRLHAA